MFTHYRTQGIFLKKEDRGEADQLFTIYTKDFGKLEILGKAIRKIKSKLRSGAELFYFSEIEFIQGKAYKTLTDAILIDKFKNLKENLQRLNQALQIADSLDSLTGKEEKDDVVWQLLLSAFQKLNIFRQNKVFEEEGKLEIIYYYFLWNLFSLLGFKPELFSCPICREKLLAETFYFVPKEGGVVCWQCFKKIKKETEATSPLAKNFSAGISVDTVKILRIFLSKNWKILPRLKIIKTERKNLKEISEIYLAFLREA